MSELNWKYEAQKQAADAGEIRIAIAVRLEEVRTQIAGIHKHLLLEDNDFDRVILEWKQNQLKEQVAWLEGTLNKPYGIGGDANADRTAEGKTTIRE